MGVDISGRNPKTEEGDYFGANWWGWRPILALSEAAMLSGKRSSDTGERYLPEAAIKALSPAEYARTTAAKRKGKAQGKQFVRQPKGVAAKTRGYR